MTAALIWLIASLVLVAAEVVSGEFVLLMLGGGAMAAAVAALLGAPILAGPLVFGGASVLLLFAVRPALHRRLDRAVWPESMHTRALVGNEAVVIARIDSGGGRIKIDGELWSARALDDKVIEPGERVTVVDISGATAMVVVRD